MNGLRDEKRFKRYFVNHPLMSNTICVLKLSLAQKADITISACLKKRAQIMQSYKVRADLEFLQQKSKNICNNIE